MQATDMPGTGNRYCQRLGIAPPDLDLARQSPRVTLADLMVLALLEAGEARSLDDIASRLARLDLPPRLARAGDPSALLRAWHGQPPLVRDPVDGRFYLDLLSHLEVHLAASIGEAPVQGAETPPDEFSQPPDDVPLSEEEVEAAFKGRALDNYSSVRRAAAILEAAGRPQPVDEVNRRLISLGGRLGRIHESTVRAWRSGLVRLGPDGLLYLDPAAPVMTALRRDIRKMAASTLRRRARHARFLDGLAEREAELAAEARRDADEARRTQRALVHVLIAAGTPRAAAVIDTAQREMRSFLGDALGDLPAHLAGFDFLAGADLRSSLRALGLDPDRWWLAELRPVARTFRPSGQGPVALTLPALVQATTGRRGIPAEPKQREALADGSAARLAAAVAKEAEALLAFYEYGALHGGVRVRRRAGEWLLPVSWTLPGDTRLSSVVEASIRRWVPVEVAVGLPTGLADPWNGARTVSIVERDARTLFVRDGDHVRVLDTADIRAIRIPDPAAAASVCTGHWHAQDDGFCRLKITLDGIAPPIWRRIDVPASIRLEKLHEMIQAALGWTNSHLHVFRAGDERIGVPYELDDMSQGMITRSGRQVTLGDVIDHGITRFGYEYDFGDSWRHTIEVEEVRQERDVDAWARCVDGARACPPEDCGGVDGYERLLEILFDPRHPEFDEMRRWAGDFQPERFDLDAANDAMAAVAYF